MINDHISDMLARIKNAYAVHKKSLSLPHTRLSEAVALVMVEEKYLTKLEIDDKAGGHKTLKLTLAYQDGSPALTQAKRVSKPGVRRYSSIATLKPVLSGMGIAILSTSQGVMSSRQAKKLHIGGEVLAQLW